MLSLAPFASAQVTSLVSPIPTDTDTKLAETGITEFKSVLAPPALSTPAPRANARAALPTLMGSNPNIIADINSAVSPAVVNIIVTTEDGEIASEGQGSGFIISPQGEVVTNYHVIDDGTTIEVEFNTGERHFASVLGVDDETDLALLQINSARTFPTVTWHDGAPIRVGEFVVPIGNPFGIGQSVSFGIISAIGRDRVDSGEYVDYIQTDATVNQGNSGGPLFNLAGEVVGVNSAIYSPTGASVGIAFAIPHYTAQDIIETLRRDGRVTRGYLGVGLRNGEYSRENGEIITKVAVVDGVVPGGPASRAGLQVEDNILAINGMSVAGATEATRIIGNIAPGGQARFRIERGDAERVVNVVIGERPSKDDLASSTGRSQSAPAPGAPRTPAVPQTIDGTGDIIGVVVLDISPEFRSAIGMPMDQTGIYVETVREGTPAHARGFRTGQMILEFDMEPIASVADYRQKVRAARRDGQSEVLVKVRLKDGQETYFGAPL